MRPQEDRLCELCSIGAAHAADALAKLFDRVVMIEPPHSRKVEVEDLAGCVFDPEEWIAGVFVEVTGGVRGQMGVAFSRETLEEVLERLGVSWEGEFDARIESVVAELGNIAVSAATSALGELAGGITLPSVPWVGFDMAGALLVEALHPHLHRLPAYIAETELWDRDQRLQLRFLWVPEEEEGA